MAGTEEIHINDLIREWLGDETYYAYLRRKMSGLERPGQAFMNSLPPEDRRKLANTDADPFYKHDKNAIREAIEFLLEN